MVCNAPLIKCLGCSRLGADIVYYLEAAVKCVNDP